MGKFIDFAEVESLASIEQLVDMLGLKVKHQGAQLRCSCPVHGGDERALAITPTVRSKRGSLGVFFCQKAQSGGDRIGLVAHCMDIGQQDAAFFIAQQFGEVSTSDGTGTGTSNSTSTVCKNDAKPAFNPVEFAKKLAYTDEVKALGYSEEEAKAFRVGFYRGHVYVPNVYPSGAVAGWSKWSDGKLVRPPTWAPDTSNVVPFKRTA